jgi:hypothetical protein
MKVMAQEEPVSAAKPAVFSLSIKPLKGEKYIFGEQTESLISLTNVSNRAVVVLAVEPALHWSDSFIYLSHPAIGKIRYDLQQDQYIHNSTISGITEILIHNGFLLPGESLAFTKTYRPLSENEKFDIVYAQAEKQYDGTPKSLLPLNVYLPTDGKWTKRYSYSRFTADTWQNMTRHNQFDITDQLTLMRPVIIPGLPDPSPYRYLYPTKSDISTRCVTLSVAIKFVSLGFTVENARGAAARITGMTPQQVQLAYSRALGGYIIMKADGSYWLLTKQNQKKKGVDLPSTALSLFRKMDASHYVSIQVRTTSRPTGLNKNLPISNTGQLWWHKYLIYYINYPDQHGEYILVDDKELSSFLTTVKAKGLCVLEYCDYLNDNEYFFLDKPTK